MFSRMESNTKPIGNNIRYELHFHPIAQGLFASISEWNLFYSLMIYVIMLTRMLYKGILCNKMAILCKVFDHLALLLQVIFSLVLAGICEGSNISTSIYLTILVGFVRFLSCFLWTVCYNISIKSVELSYLCLKSFGIRSLRSFPNQSSIRGALGLMKLKLDKIIKMTPLLSHPL